MFGVKEKNNDSKNISLENIINKIINAENNHKLVNERKISITTLKKMKDINIKKLGINLNFYIINSKIKGRNYNRYLNAGYKCGSSNYINKRKNNLFNVNNTTSNGMKNTRVSSTTIDIDLKNMNNINYQNPNTSLNVTSRKIKNKNNIITSNYPEKKSNIIQNLYTNNNKEYIMKIFKEKKTKLLNSSNRNKSNKRNIKSFSPINKSSSKNKIINVIKKENKHLSPSSSIINQISSYNHKKTNSNIKSRININKIHKSTISHSNSREKSNISQKKNQIKEISNPLNEKGFFKQYELKKINRKSINSSKKLSMSLPSNKKNLTSSNNINININKKENKEKTKLKGIKNIKNIFYREVLYHKPNHKKINSNICKRNNLNVLTGSTDNNILKSYNNIINKNKNKFNKVFSNKNIKGIQIKGFKRFKRNSNSISRNNSNTERIIFSEVLINKIGKLKENKNKVYSKTYLDLNKKKF